MAERKSTKPNFDVSKITHFGRVPTSSIPPGTHAIPGAKRRWEELGAFVRENRPGEAYKVNVPSDINVETVRQGVAAELERFDLRSRIRSVVEADGSTTLYLMAVPKDAVHKMFVHHDTEKVIG